MGNPIPHVDAIKLYEEATSGFQAWLHADGKAKRTVDSYLSDVRRFLSYVQDTTGNSLSALSREDVTGFLRHVTDEGFQPATVNKAVNSLSCFRRYLTETGIIPEDRTIVIPKRDRVKIAAGSEKEVDVLTEQQVEQLLSYVDRSDNVHQRDRLIVHLLLYTGCRVSELVDIRLKDIDPVVGAVTLRGKGDKLREVPLRSDLVDRIRGYVSGERAQSRFTDSPYLLLSQRSIKLQRDAVNTLLEMIQREGGFSFRLRPHGLSREGLR